MPQDEIHAIHAPMACTVIEVCVAAGQMVRSGQLLLILEAMKMEHEVHARCARIVEVLAAPGDQVA